MAAEADPAGEGLVRGLRDALALVWRAAGGSAAAQTACVLLTGLLPVGVAWLGKALLDGLAAGGREGGRLLALAVAVAAAGMLSMVVANGLRFAAAELNRRVALLTQRRLADAVKQLRGLARLEDPVFFDRLRLAGQAGRAGPGQVFASLLAIGQGLVTTTGFLATLAALNPWLLFLALLTVGPTIWTQVALSRRRTEMIWRTSRLERREMFYQALLTRLDAAKEIRLFGLADFFVRRMLIELGAIHREQRRMDARELRAETGMGLVGSAVAGVGIVWAVATALSGRLSVGDIAIVMAACAGTVSGLAGVVDRYGELHHALAVLTHYRAVVGAGPDLPSRPDARPAPPLRHGIELRDVWFRYGDGQPWVLRGVDLFIPAGGTLALVGLNGAGKSTLIKLLCRFYDPTRGAVRWDGVDLRDLTLGSLRRRIGAVFQDFVDYDLSAADNIGVGDPDRLADRDAVTAAARRADVHAVLAALPRGYDTMLTRTFLPDGPETDDRSAGASGVALSGGQWQRVALARGLFRAVPDLLILDEPSAGLDAEAEYQIHRRMRAERRGRTSVLISHRLNTVRDADVIAVLRDGRVVEQGTHDALVATGGPYARLFEMQASGYRDRAVAPLGGGGDR